MVANGVITVLSYATAQTIAVTGLQSTVIIQKSSVVFRVIKKKTYCFNTAKKLKYVNFFRVIEEN